MNIFAFGWGYCAQALWDHLPSSWSMQGTVQHPEKRARLSQKNPYIFLFPSSGQDERFLSALKEAEVLLISIPPTIQGDPVLSAFGEFLALCPGLKTIIYLSSLAVYGDHQGAWIDETTPPHPLKERGHRRLNAEKLWQDWASHTRKSLHILRLAGLYGPSRNMLETLKKGQAQSIVQPGHVFNRIHVEDVIQTILACLTYPKSGLWNVCDDEPAAARDIIHFAAHLLQQSPPPDISLDQAHLSLSARSFYEENKKVSNKRLKQDLRIRLLYPTYREGLMALWKESF